MTNNYTLSLETIPEIPLQQPLKFLHNSTSKMKIIPFFWEEQNYLLKMKDDLQIQSMSGLSRFINHSKKADPFLVFPADLDEDVGQGQQSKAL